ncbi:trehalose-phosphatase [Rhizobium sp. BG6]|uniref:trehalose-phosphatase n=1 Tax=Rhizobium sp. BG6 TaxID=2613771 RepID=UPI00193D176C|nr:trehalose-phosphatase [Rhizobium sp. BG6]QRM48663.1 trehalose-phosphatase [Rhizobium sp. BG6]
MPDATTPAAAPTSPQVSGAEDLWQIILLSPEDYALFLDIDGTLLDLAATPDDITVPAALPAQLHAWSQRLDGALALVTGRALTYADKLFTPHRFPIAGLHGTELRNADGAVTRSETSPAFDRFKLELQQAAEALDGVLIEDKGAAVAAHYRLAPERQAEVERLMDRATAVVGPGWALQRGKMVIELRPASADKGMAIETFLSKPPFAGRRPVAIGDDVTDEAMFAAVNRLGGHAIRIGSPSPTTAASLSLPSAAALRELIARISV